MVTGGEGGMGKGKEQGNVLWQGRGGGVKGGSRAERVAGTKLDKAKGGREKIQRQGGGEDQNCGTEHSGESSSKTVTEPGGGAEPGVTWHSGACSVLVGVGLGVLVCVGLGGVWCPNRHRAGGWYGWLAYS